MYSIEGESNRCISPCPMCNASGVLLKEKIVLRGDMFVKENIEEDCVLCLGEGSMMVIDKPYIRSDRETDRDTKESNIYRGRSPLI